MANPSKSKGTEFETRTVKLAKSLGFADAARLVLAGNLDRGDIVLVGTASQPRVIIECKYRAKPVSDARVMLWLGEAERERINSGAEFAFLVMNRPYKPIEHAWAVELETVSPKCAARPVYRYLGDYLTLLRDRGYGEDE